MSELKTIENDFLKISINPVGAELFTIYDKKANREILWQGDPAFWSSRAPVLFPIVGALKDNTIFVDQKAYSIPKHGIVRNNSQMEVALQTKDTIDFQLNANPGTLTQYPYLFSFNIRFSLRNNQLEIRHTIKNEDEKLLYFSTGGHPAFNCPFSNNEHYSDYLLEFEHTENFNSWLLEGEGLISNQTEQVAEPGTSIPLTKSLFDKNALIFTDLTSKKVTLRHKEQQKGIEVTFPDFPHLGIWAKPGAPFLCIEPWIGYADKYDTDQKIENKEGVMPLEAGEMFQASYLIKVN